jgi:ubiquinone biosynthesis protein COQ4
MQSPNTTPSHLPRSAQFLQAVDQVAEFFGQNVPQIVDLEELRRLFPGTLGRDWVDFLDRNHLSPLTTGPRRKQLHDGVHVLTGYGTDPVGEAEVQAFLLGAKFRLPHLLLLAGLIRPIQQQQTSGKVERLWRAYRRGIRSCFDIDRWEPELLWDFSLADVQTYYCIDAGKR